MFNYVVDVFFTFFVYFNAYFSCFFSFLFIIKVKLNVLLLCVGVHSAWKGCPRNDLYCVAWDVEPYSLTHFP